MTLIELLVTLAVAMIVGAAATMIVPAVLERSRVAEGERNLQRAIVAQVAYASQSDGFAVTNNEFDNLPTGRGLSFTLGSSSGRSDISVGVQANGGIAMAVQIQKTSCLGVVLENPYTSGVVHGIVAFEGVCSSGTVPSAD
jgi:Tfp pilus assembly protein PilE